MIDTYYSVGGLPPLNTWDFKRNDKGVRVEDKNPRCIIDKACRVHSSSLPLSEGSVGGAAS